MSPVFSFQTTTILHCGADRIELGVFRLERGRLKCIYAEAKDFARSPAGEDRWPEYLGATLQSLNVPRRWAGPAIVVLSPHVTLTTAIAVPRLAPSKRAQALRFAAEQAIPHPLAEVVWAIATGSQRDQEEALLVATKRDVIEKVCASVRAAGFEAVRILPSVIATLAAFRLSHPAPARSALMLNISGRATVLLQVEDDRFAARTLALGVTALIAPPPGRSAPESTGSPGTLASQLVLEIARSVRHFAREGALVSPERIILAAPSSVTAGLVGVLSSGLNLPVESWDARAAVELDPGLAGSSPDPCRSAELVGAAASALLRNQPGVDLLPPARRRRVAWRRRLPWLIAATWLAAAGLVPPLLHERQRAATALSKAVALEKMLAPLRSRDERIRNDLGQLAAIKAGVGQLQSLGEQQSAWVQLLTGLQEQLGKTEDTWLDRLECSPRVEGGRQKLSIAGRMLDPGNLAGGEGAGISRRISALLAGIASLPQVAAVEGERFDHSQPGLLRFDFLLVINPAHPL